MSGFTDKSGKDIYVTTQQCGVYLLNGTRGGNGSNYPINCSIGNINYLAPGQIIQDDGYIVYPGYGFVLYRDYDYRTGNSYSKYYKNSSSVPMLFACSSPGGYSSKCDQLILYDNGTAYPPNYTYSIKVYFNDNEIIITGLSN